jgi:hypothetical protein
MLKSRRINIFFGWCRKFWFYAVHVLFFGARRPVLGAVYDNTQIKLELKGAHRSFHSKINFRFSVEALLAGRNRFALEMGNGIAQ